MKRPGRRVGFAFAVGAFIAALVATFYRVPTTYNATVRTEIVSLVAASGPLSRWVLYGVEVQEGCQGPMRLFSGAFKPAPGTSIVLERVASGPLRIQARRPQTGPSAGDLYDAADEWLRGAGACVVFRVPNPRKQLERGLSLVFPIGGEVEIGREPRFETSPRAPLLWSGTVKLVGRAVLGQRHYDAGKVELDIGDLFVVERPLGPTSGFVAIDKNDGMTGVFRTVGSEAKVVRFAAEGFEISTSLWTRLANDPILAGVWITLGFLLGLLAKWKS